MTEHERQTHDYVVDDKTYMFQALTRSEWGDLENEVKTDAVRAWLATCEALPVSQQERRLQITDILARPMPVTVAHLERVMNKSLAMKEEEKNGAAEAVATHGNQAGNQDAMVALIAFLYQRGG